MKAYRPSETECQHTIVKAATALGFLVHHTRPARGSTGTWSTPIQGDAGFPDLVIAGHGHVLIVELKRAPNKLEVAQQAWIDALKDADVHSDVVWVPEQQEAFIRHLTRLAGEAMSAVLTMGVGLLFAALGVVMTSAAISTPDAASGWRRWGLVAGGALFVLAGMVLASHGGSEL